MKPRKNKAAKWVTLRLPPSLARKVREARVAEGLSTVEWVVRLIRKAVE